MTTFQTGSRILVAVRRETTPGTIATVTGASQVRLIGGNGLQLKRAQIQSGETLTSGLTAMGRLGAKSVDGSFEGEISAGGAVDLAIEAIMRAAWSTAVATPFSSMTTVAVQTNALVAAAGSWLADTTIKVGDIFTLASTSEASNNNRNIRAIGVTTLTISVVTGTFSVVAASATGTITRLKKIYTGATPTRYSHTVEQLDQDITKSEQFIGCRLVGLDLSFRPGAMGRITYTYMGLDRVQTAAAYFTSPALTTTAQLVADDSTIRVNGVDVANFNGFDLSFKIAAKGEPLIGSLVSPDIFDNALTVTGTITALRSDFSNLTLYDAETIFSVEIVLQEPSGTPPNCVAIYLPSVKISDVAATPVAGGDGALTETLTLMVGPKATATGYDGGIATFYSSAT